MSSANTIVTNVNDNGTKMSSGGIRNSKLIITVTIELLVGKKQCDKK